MAYDHSDKIGNPSDVVKHPVLFACARYLIQSRSGGLPFMYGESHAGRPEYILPKGGAWESGIGALSKTTAIKNDRRRRKDRQPTQLGFVGQFDETFLGRQLTIGMRYPGSTAIAFRVLRDAFEPFEMRLWETSASAADDLERYYLPWKNTVRVNRSDGYGGLTNCRDLTLALIDPPKLDTEQVIPTLKHLANYGTSYVAWQPRTSRSGWVANAGQLTAPAEAETSRTFHKLACEVGDCFGVQWYRWGARTPGCWIAVSEDLREVAWRTIVRIVELMDDGWSAITTLDPYPSADHDPNQRREVPTCTAARFSVRSREYAHAASCVTSERGAVMRIRAGRDTYTGEVP